MKGLVVGFLLLVTVPLAFAAQASLTLYEDEGDAIGYVFASNDYTATNADVYAKKVGTGESTVFSFFAQQNNFINVGKENLNEFNCDDEAAFVPEIVILERQAYCVRTADREKLIKVYVEEISESGNSVSLSWEEYVEGSQEQSTNPAAGVGGGGGEGDGGGGGGGGGGRVAVQEIEEDREPQPIEDGGVGPAPSFLERLLTLIREHPIRYAMVMIIIAGYVGFNISSMVRRNRRKKK